MTDETNVTPTTTPEETDVHVENVQPLPQHVEQELPKNVESTVEDYAPHVAEDVPPLQVEPGSNL